MLNKKRLLRDGGVFDILTFMFTQRITLFAILIVVFFPCTVQAADTDIIITEIAAYENSNHEWIEIYNNGNVQIDLTGWKFFESDTNHSLSVYRGGLIIQPGTYAIIADEATATAADYPSYQGILIDSSWTTLNEGGELIALKNASGDSVEQFTYSEAKDHSLERVDYSLNDYSSVNWKEHASGNTIGIANSTQSQQSTSPSSQQKIFENFKPGRGSVVINEIVADASDDGKEWIELYNVLPVGIDIGGWSLAMGSGVAISIAGQFDPVGIGKYKIVDLPFGTLKNAGDRIVLTDSQKNMIDAISYGSWEDGIRGDNASRAANPYSLARRRDGYRTGSDSEDFAVTSKPTRGEPNIILDPPEMVSSFPRKEDKPRILISELYSGEPGHRLNSFIELFNDSNKDISLGGWFLENTVGMRFAFDEDDIVKAHSYHIWRSDMIEHLLEGYEFTIIRLFDSYTNESPVTVARYAGKAVMNASYARKSDDFYGWTVALTPGIENVFINPPTSSKMHSVERLPINTTREEIPKSKTEGDTSVVPTLKSDVIINELFPNPEGVDTDEFIELYNMGDTSTSLAGWKMGTVKSAKQFIFSSSAIIEPRSYIVVSRQEMPFVLQNIEDGVHLFVVDGTNIDSTAYENPPVGKTWARRNDGSFVWTSDITRGKQNTFDELLSVQSTALSPMAQKKTNQSSAANTSSLVTIEGTVVVEPELFGKGLFVITNPAFTVVGESGQMKGLARGNRVRLTGRISKREGDPRFNLQKESTITVLMHNEIITPRAASGGLLTDDDIGGMVAIRGTVSKVQWPAFWIDDGIDETRVYVKKSTGIERFAFQVGDEAAVSGIVGTTAAGLRLLPRAQEDIRITPLQKEAVMLGDDDRKSPPSPLRDYLFAGAAVLAMVSGGLLINYLGKK